jgi:DNA-binding beta-propeller fold protein YncE
MHRMIRNPNQEGRKLTSGAYFVLLDMGADQASLKAVVRQTSRSEGRAFRPSELGEPMKKLLLLLVPLALYAQVEIDTVIRLPTSNLGRGYFIPELNKLYVVGESVYFVLDCSTYQVKAQIPRPYSMGLAHYSYSWRTQKLYISNNPRPNDSTLVIDAAADSVIGWSVLPYGDHWDTYASDLDRRYKSRGDTVFGFDCATDTVVQRIPPPVPGHAIGIASWDSVGRKLYVGPGSFEIPAFLGVFDYVADSFVKVIDVTSIPAWSLDALVFNYTHRKGYLAPYQPEMGAVNVGIIDTEHDTLLGVLPVRIWDGLYNQVVVNEQDDKVYLADNDTYPETPDTLWVVDCATDSVLKKVEYEPRGYGPQSIRWVPWSNRIYLNCHDWSNSSVVVLDCNADSIVERLHLGDRIPIDIQLDPVRERIFVIRADSNSVHVLRDVESGVAEEPAAAGPGLILGLQVQSTPGGFGLRYSVTSACRVDLSVYDLMGREVRQLVAEEQSAGQHSVVWNCQDLRGTRAARGVYFIRLDTPGFRDVEKVVVTR